MLNNFINYVYFIWHTVYMENALHDFISTCDPLVINPTPSRLTGPTSTASGPNLIPIQLLFVTLL